MILAQKSAKLSSLPYYVTFTDLEKFRPGQLERTILKEIQWRGYFYMAAEHKGKTVSAIVYDVVLDSHHSNGGVLIWAIFVDDKFAKFVAPPSSLPGEKEVVHIRGTPLSRLKPMKMGDDRFLIRAMDGQPLNIDDLKKEAKSITPPPEQVDPGLTAAYLLLRGVGLAPSPDAPANGQDYLRNAELRDQFNAARLKIGMSPSEVQAVLKAKPLESGEVDAGVYQIYGSNESYNIKDWLRFSNILVVYRDGKAITISGIPSGHDWRQEVGKATIDLPTVPGTN